MYNKIITMWSIFKDNNEWNEKNVVGFIAFSIRLFWYRWSRKIRKKIKINGRLKNRYKRIYYITRRQI